MVRIFLPNGKYITHVDSDTYFLQGKMISIRNSETKCANAIYNVNNIAGVAVLPKECDQYRDQYLYTEITRETTEENKDA